MTTDTQVARETHDPEAAAAAAVASEGIVAGLFGGAVIAVWFFILDVLAGRPLYTPTVLGTALFRGTEALGTPAALAVSGEMVLMFTWIHLLHFMIIGLGAAYLVAAAERNPNIGFGILLLFVFFEFAFVGACMLFAEPVLHALAWPAILVGNLLAAAAMAITLGRRHPHLRILP
jgi:hypothetical protein